MALTKVTENYPCSHTHLGNSFFFFLSLILCIYYLPPFCSFWKSSLPVQHIKFYPFKSHFFPRILNYSSGVQHALLLAGFELTLDFVTSALNTKLHITNIQLSRQ